MSAYPTGTVTFLFTDLEGSTELWESHPDAMRIALARHDAILREAINSSGGYLFKGTGDGVVAAFALAPDALVSALSAQKALTAEQWPEPVRLKSRMGLHTGSAELHDGDYVGASLNRAARLMDAGHGGQVLLSDAAQELCRDYLPEGVSLTQLGEFRLKDLTRSETIYQVVHTDLAFAFPPLRTLDNPELPNNLPRQLTSFVGRENDIQAVTSLLRTNRLITITGPGGNGKTRLSLQVAADVLDKYPDGVWLAELASISDPAFVAQTVAAAAGVREAPGQEMARTLIESLKQKRLLLLLDNVEHLLSASAVLANAILRACPNVGLLVTSREPMGITGELIYRIPALSLPSRNQARGATAVSLSQFEAVRLFIDRAILVAPGFTVTNANAPAVAQLCYRLDGIPLAIELAAARVRSMSIEQINERLGSRFRLLSGGDRTALPRQQTLRALIDWSYDLLTAKEKALLARLSAFAGGWTFAAAEAVCMGEFPDGGTEAIEAWETTDLLTSLVDKSLVLIEGSEDSSETRYRMLETLREYMREKLDSFGETAATLSRHAEWMLSVAEQLARNSGNENMASSLRQLETEHDNLRAAITWTAAGAATDDDTRSILVRLVIATWRFWHVRGYLSEGRANLTAVLEALPFDLAAAETSQTVTEADRERAKLRCSALLAAGNIVQTQGDCDPAEVYFNEEVEISRFLEDENGVISGVANLANIAWDRNDFETASRLYQQALDYYRRVDSKPRIAWALNGLANVAAEQNDLETALALCEESLTIYREKGDGIQIAWALENLGSLRCDLGDYESSRKYYFESLVISRELEIQPRIGVILSGLGSLALAEGDAKRATTLWFAVQALRDRIGAVVPQKNRDLIAGRIAEARSLLGDPAFAAASDEGRSLTWEQAVAYALGES